MSNLEKIIGFSANTDCDLNFMASREQELNHIHCDYTFSLRQLFAYPNPEGLPYKHEIYSVGGIMDESLQTFFATALLFVPSFDFTLQLAEKREQAGRLAEYELVVTEASTW